MIVWISSYPRSGNTFLRIILNSCFGQKTYSIYNDGSDIGKEIELKNITGHCDLQKNIYAPDFDLKYYRKDSQVFFIKTHEPTLDLVEKDDKIIYLIRDGRESIVSLCNYLNRFHSRQVSHFEIALGLEFPGVDWGDHVKVWDPLMRKNTLLIKFEDLINKNGSTINELSAFTGISYSNDNIPDFNDLHAINPDFFSHGKTDSWKNILSREVSLYFWLRHHKIFKIFGYEDPPHFVKNLKDEELNLISNLFKLCKFYPNQRYNNLKEKDESERKVLIEKQQNLLKDKNILSEKYIKLNKRYQELKSESESERKVIIEKQQELLRTKNSLSERYTKLTKCYEDLKSKSESEKIVLVEKQQELLRTKNSLSERYTKLTKCYEDLKSKSESEKKVLNKLENNNADLKIKLNELKGLKHTIIEKESQIEIIKYVFEELRDR